MQASLEKFQTMNPSGLPYSGVVSFIVSFIDRAYVILMCCPLQLKSIKFTFKSKVPVSNLQIPVVGLVS